MKNDIINPQNTEVIIGQNSLDINIKSIYFFMKIVECGNLTKAAELLFVSQPNLSKVIKSLEERLGFDLFAHEKNKIVLTARGEEFYKTFFPILRNIQESIVNIREYDTPKINIDVQNIMDFFKLRDMNFINPDFDLDRGEIKYTNDYRMINDINVGAADVAIVGEDNAFAYENCEFIELGEATSTIVVSSENKFAGRKSVTLEDIKNEKFVFHIEKPYDETTLRAYFIKYCEKRGFDPNNISFAENYQTALLNVVKNQRIAISSDVSPHMFRSEMISIPIEDYKIKILMAVRKDLSKEKRAVAMKLL